MVRRKSGEIVARWPLTLGEYTFGAARGNDLQLDQPGVSSRHARLIVREGEVLIEDLCSRYGTRRGGELIVGRVPVTKFRPVEIGDLVIEAEMLEQRIRSDLPIATLGVDSGLAARSAMPAKAGPPRMRWAGPVLAVGLGVLLLTGLAMGCWQFLAHENRARETAVAARQAAEAGQHRAEAALAATRRTAPAATAPEPEPSRDAALLDRLRPYRSQPGWTSQRLRRLPGGSHSLDLSGLALGDLAELRGLPVSELDLSRTALSALPELRGFTLRRLVLTGTAVRDLAPLRGQPLEELHLDETGVASLAPLAGLPLTTLTLHGTPVNDLAPLAGMPLHTLDLRDHTGLRDFRPLLECRRLTVLYAPAEADLDCLRGHPSLRLIALRKPASPEPGAVDGPMPVSAFWDKYGDLMRRRTAEHAR